MAFVGGKGGVELLCDPTDSDVVYPNQGNKEKSNDLESREDSSHSSCQLHTDEVHCCHNT